MTLEQFYFAVARNMIVSHGGREHVCEYHRGRNLRWIEWMARTWRVSGCMTLDQLRMATMAKNEGRSMHPFQGEIRLHAWNFWTSREYTRMTPEPAVESFVVVDPDSAANELLDRLFGKKETLH
jgi:hypothetical protein